MKTMIKKQYSQKDLIDTMRSIEYGYNGWTVTQDQKDGIYAFLSELTGKSVNELTALVKEENDKV